MFPRIDMSVDFRHTAPVFRYWLVEHEADCRVADRLHDGFLITKGGYDRIASHRDVRQKHLDAAAVEKGAVTRD